LRIAWLLPDIVPHEKGRPEFFTAFLRIGHFLDKLLEVLQPGRPDAKEHVARRVQHLVFVLLPEVREQNHHENGERPHCRDEEIERRHGKNLDRTRGAVHGGASGSSPLAEEDFIARGTMRWVVFAASSSTTTGFGGAKPNGANNHSAGGFRIAAVVLSCFG